LEQVDDEAEGLELGEFWPWSPDWFKPSPDPIRDLVKVGALAAAEIDRIQRVREKEGLL
jgi:hypothetical protein